METCRNKKILNYFGEEAEKNCRKCDNCERAIQKDIQSINVISNAIQMSLFYESKDPKHLFNELKEVVEEKSLKKTIKHMLDEEILQMNNLNQIQLNKK